jgi:hypothetical protein
MTTNVRGYIPAGLRTIFYGALDGDGELIGSSTTPPTAGNVNGNGLKRLAGAVTVSPTIPEGENLNIIGDDEALVQFPFASATLPSGQMSVAVVDMDFEALVQGTAVHNLGGDLVSGVLQPSGETFTNMTFLFLRRSQTYNASSVGAKKWAAYLIPNGTVSVLGEDANTRENSPTNYQIRANRSDRYPFGVTFQNTNIGTDGAPILRYDSDNPLHQKRYTGDGTVVTFNLDYTPISVAKTRAYVNGNPVTVASISTTLKTVTLSAAPANNAKLQVFYEFDETDLA